MAEEKIRVCVAIDVEVDHVAQLFLDKHKDSNLTPEDIDFLLPIYVRGYAHGLMTATLDNVNECGLFDAIAAVKAKVKS